MHLKKTILTFLWIVAAGSLSAQTHNNAWFRGAASATVHNKYKFDVEVQHRRQNGAANTDMLANNLMLSARVWAHYQPTDHIKFSISPIGVFANYVPIQKRTDEYKTPTRELRCSAATELTQPIWGQLQAMQRTAAELRSFNTAQPNIIRLRERIGIRYNIKTTISVTAFDELLLNVAGVSFAHLYDHNRVGLDLEYRGLTNIKLNIGYMRINRLPLSGATQIQENNAFLNFTYLFTHPHAKTA